MARKPKYQWEHYPLLQKELNCETDLSVGTKKYLDWKCSECSHEWSAPGNRRVSLGAGCPACAGKVVNNYDGRNSLAVKHPDIAKQCVSHDPTKLVYGSGERVDWRCDECSYEWSTTVISRTNRETGCAACYGQVVKPDGSNSLATMHPEIAKQVIDADPTKLTHRSNQRVTFECPDCGDRKNYIVRTKTGQGVHCGACNNRRVKPDGTNSLAAAYPELARECLEDATQLTMHNKSNKTRWQCSECSHRWRATVKNRALNKSGCPQCAKTGFNPGNPGYYYVHEILNEAGDVLYYKGGISNNWEKRLKELSYGLPNHLSIRNVGYIHFEEGADAQWLETELKRISEIRAPKRDFGGGDELFLVNPMEYWGLGSDS